jgi:glycosyltransferase involved in cell wall biosynthesis
MHVLHLDAGREMRGGQRQALLLYEGLQRVGVEQRVLCRGEMLEQTGGEELSAGAVRQAAGRADLIHAHDARSHTLAVLLGRGRPVVVSRRVAFPVQSGLFSRWKYRQAALYLAVSAFVRDRLVEAGVDEGRIRIVPDGLPAPDPLPVFREPSARPLVVAPDSADPLKGSALARKVCERAGFALKLSSDLAADLPAADIFLYLTESEGLGSALILAGMHAKPIVASRVGGAPEVVADGETGLLVRNDPNEVARALDRLRGDPALARRLAEAAQARAAAELSDDKMVGRTLEAYRSVLGASSAK